MSKQKFVSLCLDKLDGETAKIVLKTAAKEMPIVEDCLYKMFKDNEVKVCFWPVDINVVPPQATS